ncbi:MAG: hypothetical protein HRU20_30085 [Pseudomonadales bacterium]|nr:hypothetical protein [Pseudomonadales bacterium]
MINKIDNEGSASICGQVEMVFNEDGTYTVRDYANVTSGRWNVRETSTSTNKQLKMMPIDDDMGQTCFDMANEFIHKNMEPNAVSIIEYRTSDDGLILYINVHGPNKDGQKYLKQLHLSMI